MAIRLMSSTTRPWLTCWPDISPLPLAGQAAELLSNLPSWVFTARNQEIYAMQALEPNASVPRAEDHTHAISQALHRAHVALDNVVMVMTRELAGLRVIQPELSSARAAMAEVEAVIELLQLHEPIPAALLDDLMKLSSNTPTGPMAKRACGDQAIIRELSSTYGASQIKRACAQLNLSPWEGLE